MIQYIKNIFSKKAPAKPGAVTVRRLPDGPNGEMRVEYLVPIDSRTTAESLQYTKDITNKYKEEIKFNESDGTIDVMKRDLWIPVKNQDQEDK